MSQDVQGVDMVWIQVYLSQAKELPLLSLASEVPTFARSEILCSGQGKKNGVIPIRTSTCDTWLEQI